MNKNASAAANAPPRLARGRPTGRVSWHALTLQGFGPFREQTRVEFPDGLVTAVGPNETGKSTLVLGLTAVLFGLRAARDPRAFGQERFRHWGSPERFAGELEFSAGDGQGYRLRRDFDTHAVELLRREGTGWVSELRGTHNPGARRRNLEFEQRLQDLIGIGSREVFSATFCVNQPLPGMIEIDEAVQQLLSGAGGPTHPKALDHLSQQLSSITRRTADFGVTARNGLREQRLDELQRHLQAGARDLAETRDAMGSLPPLEAEIQQLEQEREELRRAGVFHEVVMDALGQWTGLAQRRHSLVRHGRDLEEAGAQARRLQHEARELGGRLAEDPASQLDQEAEQRLEILAHLEREESRLRAESADVEAEMRVARDSLDEMEQLFRQEFVGLEGRPDPVRALESLKERVQELAAHSHHLVALGGDEEALLGHLQRLPDLGSLGRPLPDVCLRLQEDQADALRKWQRWYDSRARLDEVDRELGDYSALERADDETLETLRNHAALREQWLAQRYEAVHELEQVELRRMAATHEQTRIRNSFVDVAALDASLIPAIEAKIRLAERKDEMEDLQAEAYRTAASLSERRLWLVVSMLLTGLALGGLVPLLLKAHAATSLAMSVLGAALLGAVGGGVARFMLRDPLQGLQQKREELERETAEVDERLGLHARDATHRLAAIKERWERWQERQKEFDENFRDLPPLEHVTALRERRDAAEKALTDLKLKIRGYAMQFRDPVEALQRWKELRNERDRLETERRAFCHQEWGCGPEEVPDLTLEKAGGAWKRLGDLVACTGQSRDERVLELVRTLRAVDDSWWHEVQERAEAWEELASRLDAVRGEREHLTRPDGQGKTLRDRLEERIQALRDLVAPYDEHTEVEQVGRMVATARTMELRIQAARSRVEELERRQSEVRDDRARVESEVLQLKDQLTGLLQAADWSLAAARARWRGLQETRRQLEIAESALSSILGLWRVDSVDALERLEGQSLAAIRALDESLRSLSGRFEELPRAEEVGNEAVLAAVEGALRVRGNDLRERVQGNGERLRSLEACHARLQGRDLVNLAVGQRDLDRVRAEVEELELEAESLACAWGELQATVDEFQGSHRERLEQAATRRFEEISGRVGRAVCLDANFRVSVREEGGRPVLPVQLSQGARDQLYLCLRLAISDLVAPALRLPFVFDDPFLNCDEGRLERLRQVLARIARDRQVIVLSHRASIASWGRPVVARG